MKVVGNIGNTPSYSTKQSIAIIFSPEHSLQAPPHCNTLAICNKNMRVHNGYRREKWS